MVNSKPEDSRDDSPCDGCSSYPPTTQAESDECELCIQRQRNYK
jgi:hypothetical protein